MQTLHVFAADGDTLGDKAARMIGVILDGGGSVAMSKAAGRLLLILNAHSAALDIITREPAAFGVRLLDPDEAALLASTTPRLPRPSAN